MKNLFISLLLIFSILGCTSITKISDIKESATSVANGNITHEIKSVELTSTEITIVDHSINNLKFFIDRWRDSVNVANIDEFNSEYKKMKSDYLALYKVIENNFDKYPDELKNKFINYKESAKALDNQVTALIVGKDVYKTIKVGVKVAMVVVGMLK